MNHHTTFTKGSFNMIEIIKLPKIFLIYINLFLAASINSDFICCYEVFLVILNGSEKKKHLLGTTLSVK